MTLEESDNKIPFGNASFSDLDSIINTYEMHGNYKKVVELLKELKERRKQPEIIYCKDCAHYHTDVFGGELGLSGIWKNIIVAHNACDKWTKDMNCVTPDGFCFLAERRTDATD